MDINRAESHGKRRKIAMRIVFTAVIVVLLDTEKNMGQLEAGNLFKEELCNFFRMILICTTAEGREAGCLQPDLAAESRMSDILALIVSLGMRRFHNVSLA